LPVAEEFGDSKPGLGKKDVFYMETKIILRHVLQGHELVHLQIYT
jgi:hypothetical protein